MGSPQFLSLRLTLELPPYLGLLLGACQVPGAMEAARWSSSKYPYSCCEGPDRGMCAKVNEPLSFWIGVVLGCLPGPSFLFFFGPQLVTLSPHLGYS